MTMRLYIVHLLLRLLRHRPGTVINHMGRRYIVDNHGTWMRIVNEKSA